MSPPSAPNPDGMVASDPPFNFTRLGVRVPAVAVSPWTRRGTVVNNPAAASANESVVYEHSSIAKTLHELFAPHAAPLTAREVFAAPFHTAVVNEAAPRTDCPSQLPPPPSHREVSRLGAADGRRAASALHRSLAHAAAGVAADVLRHLRVEATVADTTAAGAAAAQQAEMRDRLTATAASLRTEGEVAQFVHALVGAVLATELE